MPLEIRLLNPDDDRSTFQSGNEDLDRFFRRYAGQNQFRHHVGVSYVALENERIVGFVTVAPCHMEIDGLPLSARRRFPRYPLPVLRVARLAVQREHARMGVGGALIRAAFGLAVKLSKEAGCIGMLVDAKSDAVSFYQRLGFERVDSLEGALEERPTLVAMFLPLALIPQAR